MENKFNINMARYIIAAGEFIQGYDTSIVGVALLFMNNEFHFDAYHTGLLIGVTDLGGIIGLLGCGYLADRFGRKAVFNINLIVFTIFAIISGFAQDFTQIFITRFILGIAIGADIPVICSFLGEIAPANKRGRFVAFTPQFFQILGVISASALGLFFRDGGNDVWRWLFIAGAVPAIIIFMARRHLPESPVWLAKAGRMKEAEDACKQLGIKFDVQSISQKPTRLKELLTPKFMIPMSAIYLFGILHCMLSPISSKATPYILRYGMGSSVTTSFELTILIQVGAIIGMYIGSTALDLTNRKKAGSVGLLLTGVLYLLVAFVGIPSHSMIIMGGLYFLLMLCYWTFIPTMAYVWSTELFPVRLRATANGIQFSSCRVGSVIGSNLIIMGMATIGLEKTIALATLPVLGMWIILMTVNSLHKNQGKELNSIEQEL